MAKPIGATAEETANAIDEPVEAVQRQFTELECAGCLMRTGQFRNGWSVFVTTDRGKAEAERALL
jgi:hypothetical protein